MELYYFVLIVFGGVIVALGVMLVKRIRAYRAMPEEETHTERSHIQDLLKKHLEQSQQQNEEQGTPKE